MKKGREKTKHSKNLTLVRLFGLIVAITVIAVSGGVLLKKDDNGITRRHTCGIYEPYWKKRNMK